MTQPRTNKNWLFGYTHTLRSNLLNDFRIGYHRIDFDTLNPFSVDGKADAGTSLGIPGFDGDTKFSNPGIPSINVSNFSGIGAGGTNWFQFDTTFQVSNVLAWTRGSHAIRAGFDLRRLSTGRRAANDPRGLFNFTGDITGYSMADFMLGLPRTVIPPTDQIQGHVGGWRNGIFVNDVWQALAQPHPEPRPALGDEHSGEDLRGARLDARRRLRDDHPVGHAGRLPGQGLRVPPRATTRTSAPRLGATYRLGEKTVLRAGFGIYYNPNQMNSFTFLTNNPPRGPGHHLHLGPGQPDPLVHEPDRPARGPAAARHDLADAQAAQRAQDPVELRRPA